MRKNTAEKTGMIICAVILIAAVVMSVNGLTGLAHSLFSDTDDYSAGDAVIDRQVKNLVIDWTDGKVSIGYHSDNTVEISEKSKKAISKDRQMCWQLDGDTLRIKYEKTGFRLFSGISPEKELTVTLPEGTVLEDAVIGATSGILNIPALQAENLTMEATSGDIFAAVEAKKIKAETTSGNIELQVAEDAEEISVSSTSGSISFTAENADKVQIESTSGDSRVTLKNAEDFRAGSTSGNIRAEIGKAGKAETDSTSGNVSMKISGFESLDLDSTSGDITVSLPEVSGFTAHLGTTGGKLGYDLPLTKEGNEYICGDGNASVKISTTSGNITLGKF